MPLPSGGAGRRSFAKLRSRFLIPTLIPILLPFLVTPEHSPRHQPSRTFWTTWPNRLAGAGATVGSTATVGPAKRLLFRALLGLFVDLIRDRLVFPAGRRRLPNARITLSHRPERKASKGAARSATLRAAICWR